MTGNLSVVLARRPSAAVEAADLRCMILPMPVPGPGELLVRTDARSLDPYMASATQGRHMSGAISPGDVMPGEIVGTVVTSRHAAFAIGDQVLTRGGWRAYCIANGDATAATGLAGVGVAPAYRLQPPAGMPASAYLGVLGMPGLTAYAVMTRCLRPVPGATAVVMAATGAVGSAAGQIAREMGARVVAVVGTSSKARHALEFLKFDAAVVRGGADFAGALQHACPDGIDVLMSNDGGPGMATLLDQLALHARVALIGDMSQYNSVALLPGPALSPLIARRATVTGFVVFDHFDLLAHWQRLALQWIAQGDLVFQEDRVDGLEAAPEAFARLMRGQTMGKSIVQVAAH